MTADPFHGVTLQGRNLRDQIACLSQDARTKSVTWPLKMIMTKRRIVTKQSQTVFKSFLNKQIEMNFVGVERETRSFMLQLWPNAHTCGGLLMGCRLIIPVLSKHKIWHKIASKTSYCLSMTLLHEHVGDGYQWLERRRQVGTLYWQRRTVTGLLRTVAESGVVVHTK